MKELAIIIPTYKKAQNVPVLVERINRLQYNVLLRASIAPSRRSTIVPPLNLINIITNFF